MMASPFIPLMSLMFSFMFMMALVQFSPSLAGLATLLSVSGAVLKINYHRKKLPRFLMDVLDRLTNKAALEASFTKQLHDPVVLDAEQLAAKVKSRVIGQDACIDRIAAQLRRRYAARRPDKPIAVFCLAGPPGVGKTYLAKVLAEELFGVGPKLHFFDMSQFGQPHAASSLFGQARGYVGSTSYGSITAALRDEPQCLVLLDEFEKAHPEVHKRFLTAWNDGFVTEVSDGARVPTNEAVFILTTNAATRRIGEIARDHAGDADEQERLVKQALLDANFAPEVLSRIDSVFAFRPVEGLDIARVVALEIEKLTRQFGISIADGGIDPSILLAAIEKMQGRTGGGVRDIARAIERDVTDGLIEARARGARTVKLKSAGHNILVEVADYKQDQVSLR